MTNNITRHNHEDAQRVALLMISGFSMIGFSATVEPLQVANRLAGRQLFECTLLTIDGEPAASSSGISIHAEGSIAELPVDYDLIIVCSGFFDLRNEKLPRLYDWLRKLAALGRTIGAISTGAEILATAGLLKGCRCTIHWENDESFRENHPSAILTGGIYEMNNRRITAAGGIASLDMMLSWIARTNDEFFVAAIAEQFVHDPSRTSGEIQRNTELRLARRRSPKLAKAIEIMMSNVENPLASREISRKIGLSCRQLERLFSRHRHKTPHKYYLELRLNRARYLIFHTSLPIIQVSIATGFSSQSHFSRRYMEYFSSTPSKDRQSGIL